MSQLRLIKLLGAAAVTAVCVLLPATGQAFQGNSPPVPPLDVQAVHNIGLPFGYTPFTCPADAPRGCFASPALGAYQIGFQIPSGGGSLVAGDTITFQAPSGVEFPTDPAAYTVGWGSTQKQVCQSDPFLGEDCATANVGCFDSGQDPRQWDITQAEARDEQVTLVGTANVPDTFTVREQCANTVTGLQVKASANTVTVTLPPGFSLNDGDPTPAALEVDAATNPPAGTYNQLQWTVEAADGQGNELYAPGFATNSLPFVTSTPDQYNSTLEAASAKVPVSLSNGAALTATIRDHFGNPIQGDQVTIEANTGHASQLNPSSSGLPTTGADGTVSSQFSDTVAEVATFQAYDTTSGFTLFETPSITFTPGPPDPASSDVIVTPCSTSCPPDPSSVSTDGGHATVTVQLADQFGNPTIQPGTGWGDEVALEPQAGFTKGDIEPLGSDCASQQQPTVPAGAGIGCTNTPTLVAIGPAVHSVGQAQFRVSDPRAEDVQFAIEDLTTATILDSGPSDSSRGMQFTIDFAPGPPSAGTAGNPESTITPSTQQVGADGQSTGKLTVTLKDDNGNPVPGYQVSLTPSAGNSAAVTPQANTNGDCQASAGTTDCNGQAVFDVSDTTLEDVTFTATYSGTSPGTPESGSVPGSAVVEFVAGPASTSKSTVAASRNSLLDDGTQTSRITVTLLDNAGHPAAGRAVSLNGSAGTKSQITPLLVSDASSGCSGTQAAAGTTDCNGVAEFSVTDTNPEAVTYTAADTTDTTGANNTPTVIDQQPTVAFTPPPSPQATTVTASPPSVAADGATASTVTVTLEDSSGKPIAGKQLCLTQTKSVAPTDDCSTQAAPSPSTIAAQPISGSTCSGSTAAAGTTNCNGQARFAVTATSPGSVTYGIVDTSDYGTTGPLLGPFTTVTFTTAPSEAGQSTVTASPSTVLAGASGTSGTAVVTVTLRDAAGNPTQGHTVQLVGVTGSPTITAVQTSGAGCGTQAPAGTTDCTGQAQFAVGDATPETVSFVAKDTTASPQVTVFEHASVAFLPDEAATSTVVASPATVSANGGATSTGVSVVTVTLDPGQPSATAGDAVSLTPTGGHSTIVPRAIPDAVSGCRAQASPGTADCQGQVRFAVTDATPETVTYGASDDSTGVSTGAHASVTFQPAPPAVTGIRPAAGPLAGGNQVRISGRELTIGGATPQVSFGSRRATKVRCSSSDSCTATAPAGRQVGSVGVVVVTSAGASTAAAAGTDTYSYRGPRPAVTRIKPGHGPSGGGTVITVIGTGLGAVGESSVHVGSATVNPLSVNSAGTKLKVKAPAEVAGTVAVSVTTRYGTSRRTKRTRFTYLAKPRHRKHR